MHKLINRPIDVVREMLEGFARAYEHDVVLTRDLIVARRVPKAAGKVGLVIGNGSGHEPAMIGWVGPGLFDVNVPGEIFAAPDPERILGRQRLERRAYDRIDGSRGAHGLGDRRHCRGGVLNAPW